MRDSSLNVSGLELPHLETMQPEWSFRRHRLPVTTLTSSAYKARHYAQSRETQLP